MYLFRDQALELLNELGATMAAELKEKTDFMLSLLDTDNWSMIIKSHALVESLVTELIVSQTEEHKLKALIERLPLSDAQIGKIKIAKDYELLSIPERAFVKRFSELRNNLAHKIENVTFDIDAYVSNLDKNQRKSWQSAFTWYEHGKEVKNSWSAATIGNPKLAIWLAVFMFISLASVKISELKGQSSIRLVSEQTTKQLLS